MQMSIYCVRALGFDDGNLPQILAIKSVFITVLKAKLFILKILWRYWFECVLRHLLPVQGGNATIRIF